MLLLLSAGEGDFESTMLAVTNRAKRERGRELEEWL